METEELDVDVKQHSLETCSRKILPVRDALEVLNGKWKLPIIISLSFGTKRFRQISREVSGITDRMLSKELKMVEENKLITRKVLDSFPPTVEYTLTEHGATLQNVIMELGVWGQRHREVVMGAEAVSVPGRQWTPVTSQ